MSVTLRHKPNTVDFLGNGNGFEFLLSGRETPATLGKYSFKTGNLSGITEGSLIVFTVNGMELTYTVSNLFSKVQSGDFVIWNGNGVQPPSGDVYSYLSGVLNKNYYISENFDVSCTDSTNGATLVFDARTAGYIPVEIKVTTSTHSAIGNWFEKLTDHDATYDGADAVRADNYGLALRLNANGKSSDWFVLHPDNVGRVRYVPKMLGSYMGDPVAPGIVGEIGWEKTEQPLPYTLQYAEIFGNPARIFEVSTFPTHSTYYMMDGELLNGHAALGLADWDNGTGETEVISTTDKILVFGKDTGCTVDIRRNNIEYIYLYSNTARKADVEITAHKSDGTFEVVTISVDMDAHTIHRVCYGPDILGVDDVIYFDVACGSWGRTYIVRPSLYENIHFLLYNKYGLLEPVECMGESVETTADGTSMSIGGKYDVEVTNAYERYTARTEMMHSDELRAIAQGIQRAKGFVLIGETWEPIRIEPTSIVYHDSGEDMLQAEFSYRFYNNQKCNNLKYGIL